MRIERELALREELIRQEKLEQLAARYSHAHALWVRYCCEELVRQEKLEQLAARYSHAHAFLVGSRSEKLVRQKMEQLATR
jgi:hypothetical protein